MRMFQSEISPRESFSEFPKWFQPFITFISGKPSSHEKPFFIVSPWNAIIIDLAKLVAGILGSAFAYTRGEEWRLIIPLFWILTVNGVRSLTSDAHYAGHSCITGSKGFDYWVGEFISMLVLSANMQDYARGHNQNHHGRDGIVTLQDPDLELMFLLGFDTGQSQRWYWWRLVLSIISPRYHIIYTWKRIESNFLTARWEKRLISYSLYSGLFYMIGVYKVWDIFLVAWAFPLFPLVAISAALQFPSEHFWLMDRDSTQPRKIFIRKLSHGRFFLVAAPRKELKFPTKIYAWCIWAVLMIRPLFERFFVCVSILPAHDYHHRHARVLKWPMEPYLRQEEIDQGTKDYTEYYGLKAVYEQQFKLWSALPSKNRKKYKTLFGFLSTLWHKRIKCSYRMEH